MNYPIPKRLFILIFLLLSMIWQTSHAATPEENQTLYDHSRKTIAEMQKRVWTMRQWWIKKADIDTAAKHYALTTLSPLKGIDDYFVQTDLQVQRVHNAFINELMEEADYHKETDRLMDDALAKLYWSYVYHSKARVRDMKNSYSANKDALLTRYQQQLTSTEKQHGRLSDATDEKSRQLLAAVANYEVTLRNEAKSKYVNAMQEAILLRRHMAQQFIDWIDTIEKMKRGEASKFFKMRMYDLLECNLADMADDKLEKIFTPTLWGGKDVDWVKYNGSALDRDLLSAREVIFTFTPLQVPMPGPGFLKEDRVVSLGKKESMNMRTGFSKEPISWLVKNQTVKQAM